ncbi:MAG: hypothetical protein AAGA83_25745 [Cyanobacteria bacterium P01_F01_bin.116]
MSIEVQNHQENLCLDLEHDSGYKADFLKRYEETEKDLGKTVLVFNASDQFDGIEGVKSCAIYVEPDYPWNLSPGQQKTYELLLPLQTGSVYAMTTVSKLAEAMELKTMWAVSHRLRNLQSLGIISGLRL